MADNVEANSGSGGATFATDDIGGVHYPRSKVVWGPDGTANDADDASGKRLPVKLAEVGSVVVPVSDNSSSLTVDNAGTFAVQVDGAALTALQLIDDAIATAGSAITAKGTAVAGTDGTDARILKTDASGELQVDVLTLPNVTIGAALPAGTNAIGKLAANSGVDIGDVDITSIAAGDNNIGNVDLASAIPAGTNLIGKIAASAETTTIYDGATALTPKFAVIDNATSGDNTILAAVASKKIRVHQLALIASAAVTIRFESGAGGTALTGQMQVAANGGFVLPFSPMGWFETAVNTLLNMELSGATSVDGVLGYTEV